jgi:hypothetical protein
MNDLNRNALEEMLDIETPEITIESFRETLNKVKQIEDPTNVLTSVIEKAGSFLDLIEIECVNGAMSARYAEVAATILNTLITAANSIVDNESKTFNDKLKQIRIYQRDKEIEQKDKELEIKDFYYRSKLQVEQGGSTNTTNILVTDRESLMKYLQKGNTKELGDK